MEQIIVNVAKPSRLAQLWHLLRKTLLTPSMVDPRPFIRDTTQTVIRKSAVITLIGFSVALASYPIAYLVPPLCHRIYVVWKLNQFNHNLLTPIGAYWQTKLIKRTLTRPPLESSCQRQVFRDTPLAKSWEGHNKSHPSAAVDRNSASTTSVLMATQLGLTPYFLQRSLSDQRRGYDGDRSYHWAKDLGVDPVPHHFDGQRHACIIIDADWYLDMNHLLSHYPGTYFIYTIQPTHASFTSDEIAYRFNSDQSLTMHVTGGSEFRHMLYHYKGDTIGVVRTNYFSSQIFTYHVDRRHISPSRVLVMLSPIASFSIPLIPAHFVMSFEPLTRLKPVQGEFVVINSLSPEEGFLTSISHVGSWQCATVLATEFDAIMSVARSSKNPITPAMVASNIAPSTAIGLPQSKLAPGVASLISEYARYLSKTDIPVIYPPSAAMVVISFGKDDHSAHVPLKSYGSPLVDPCYVFPSSLASDDACIKGRVEPFHTEDYQTMPAKLVTLMYEFVCFLVPEPHIGHPVSEDEVRDRQPRPNQQHKLQLASLTGRAYKHKVSAFNKVETYTKPTVPRNISEVEAYVKLNHSRYNYSFGDQVLANQPWYAFSKPPCDVAARVASICEVSARVNLSDGKKYDGHKSFRARVLQRMYLFRFFNPKYHGELHQCLDEQIGLSATTRFGRSYNTGQGQLSGSADTSIDNSIGTAFIDYMALRSTIFQGRKLTPIESWNALGMYGGDDGISGDIDPELIIKAANAFGQDYDTTTVQRGNIGVEFLNRQFGPYVWTGDPNSMCNPLRALSKLWIAPVELKEPTQRFAERFSGYYRTDKHTPVLGDIVFKAHQILGSRIGGELCSWDGFHAEDVQWPNQDSDWMLEVFSSFLPDFNFDKFDAWINSIAEPQDFFRAPLCVMFLDSKNPKITCVLGEELHVLPPEPSSPLPQDALFDIPANWLQAMEPQASSISDTDLLQRTTTASAHSDPDVSLALQHRHTDAKGKTVIVTAPNQTEQVFQCGHRDLSGKAKVCVCQWGEPKLRKGEDPTAFEQRKVTWFSKRAFEAKRQGLIDRCNGNNGSWTNTDDHGGRPMTKTTMNSRDKFIANAVSAQVARQLAKPRKTRKNIRKAKKGARRITRNVPMDMEQNCLNDYAKMYCDHFSPDLLPCAPFGVSRPSLKYGARQRFSWSSGTVSTGFFLYDPYAAYNQGELSVRYTQSTSVIAITQAASAATNQVTAAVQAPFTPPNTIGPGIARVRLVGSAIRVRCTHAVQTTQGSIAAFRVRGNGSMDNALLTLTSCMSDIEAKAVSCASLLGGDWLQLMWLPADEEDEDYYNATAEFPNGTTIGGGLAGGAYGCLALIAYGTAAGQAFETEVVSYYEYISLRASVSATKTVASPEAASKIADFFGGTAANVSSSIGRYVASHLPALITSSAKAYTAIKMAQAYIPAVVSTSRMALAIMA